MCTRGDPPYIREPLGLPRQTHRGEAKGKVQSHPPCVLEMHLGNSRFPHPATLDSEIQKPRFREKESFCWGSEGPRQLPCQGASGRKSPAPAPRRRADPAPDLPRICPRLCSFLPPPGFSLGMILRQIPSLTVKYFKSVKYGQHIFKLSL